MTAMRLMGGLLAFTRLAWLVARVWHTLPWVWAGGWAGIEPLFDNPNVVVR